MTRAYAAVALLRHGPLTLSQFFRITCWPTTQECIETLNSLRLTGQVRRRNVDGNHLYEAV